MITRLVFFLGGVACLAAFLLQTHPPKVLYGLGWLGLLFAYFLWLIQTYKSRAPLTTRGGPLRFDQQPRLYKWVFLFWLAIGLFMALVALVISLNL
jgi:hypothetical protein